MTDQKHEETATGEAMPEALSRAEQDRVQAAINIAKAQEHPNYLDKQPPVDNDHVAPGAELFTTAPVAPPSPLEIEVAYLRNRLHEMEVALHAYLSTQTSVGHARISAWVQKTEQRMKRLGSLGSHLLKDMIAGGSSHATPPVQTETSPASAPSDKAQTESSTSKT
jgi:hypothetical protein